MKFVAAASSLLTTVGFVQGQFLRPGDHRRHNLLWTFGNDGVKIFTPSGDLVKTIGPERACHDTGTVEEPNPRCFFLDVETDGRKYVWATVYRGEDKMDIFDITTGSLVGSSPTCGQPWSIDYHPGREELWVHCSDFDKMNNSTMDVFSAAAPFVPQTTNLKLHDGTLARSYGQLAVDEAFGDYAYATIYGQKTIYKIDLAQREVEKELLIDNGNPRLSGFYDLAYSSVNQHLYLRTQVCCTCGFAGADNLECGRYGSQNITLEGQIVEGQCGRHCEGTFADTIGVIEYDTVSETIVGTITSVGGTPIKSPFVSPDGQHIVFFGANGGSTIDIYKPNGNGQKSVLDVTLSLDFDTSADEDIVAFDDVAYIKTSDMNLFVVASAIDFKVALVDMNTSPPAATYISLSDMPWPEDQRARTRQIEWLQGTDFVWVGGRMEQQLYVIDFRQKKLLKTITATDVNVFLAVRNDQFYSYADDMNSYWEETGVLSSGEGGSSSGERGSQSQAALGDVDSNGGDSSDALSIAALAMSCIAIVAVFTNFVLSAKKSDNVNADASLAGKRSEVPPSVQ